MAAAANMVSYNKAQAQGQGSNTTPRKESPVSDGGNRLVSSDRHAGHFDSPYAYCGISDSSHTILRTKTPMIQEVGKSKSLCHSEAADAAVAGTSINYRGRAEAGVVFTEDEIFSSAVMHSDVSTRQTSMYLEESEYQYTDSSTDAQGPNFNMIGTNNKIVIHVKGDFKGNPQFKLMMSDRSNRCTQTSRPQSILVSDSTMKAMVPATDKPTAVDEDKEVIECDGPNSEKVGDKNEPAGLKLDQATWDKLLRIGWDRQRQALLEGGTPPRATSSPIAYHYSPPCSHCFSGSHPKPPPPDLRTTEWVATLNKHGGVSELLRQQRARGDERHVISMPATSYTPLVMDGRTVLERQGSEERYMPMHEPPVPFLPAPHDRPNWTQEPSEEPARLMRKGSSPCLPAVLPTHIRDEARQQGGYIDKLSISQDRKLAVYKKVLDVYRLNDMMYFIWRKDEYYIVISFVYQQEIHDLFVFYAEDGFLHMENSQLKARNFSEIVQTCKGSIPVNMPTGASCSGDHQPKPDGPRCRPSAPYKVGLKRAVDFGATSTNTRRSSSESEKSRKSETSKRPSQSNHSPPVPARRHRDSRQSQSDTSRSSSRSQEVNYEMVLDRQSPNG